jgi:hypothetical protein
VLQIVEVREFVPVIRVCRRRAPKDEPDAVGICRDRKKTESNLGSEQWTRIGSGEHQCACNENDSKRRNFDKEIDAFVECDKNEFLCATFAEQGSFKQHLGEDTPKPDANEGEVKGQEY